MTMRDVMTGLLLVWGVDACSVLSAAPEGGGVRVSSSCGETWHSTDWLLESCPEARTNNGQRTVELHLQPLHAVFTVEGDRLMTSFPELGLNCSVEAPAPPAEPPLLWGRGLQPLLPGLAARFTDAWLVDLAALPLSGAAWPAGPALPGVLDALVRRGLALLTGAPGVETLLEQIAPAMGGFVHETNWGRSFAVRAEVAPVSLAFTPLAVSLHTDNPYRDPVPTVQALHCLRSAKRGGRTRFADGFAAAAALRQEDPAAFALLVNTPRTFRYYGDGVDLRARQPVIELADGEVVRVSLNSRAVEPLVEDSAAYYVAYRKFQAQVEAHAVELAMEPGDVALWDNRRVLHGRTDFEGERYLRGLYIDMDGVRSKHRLLQQPAAPEAPIECAASRAMHLAAAQVVSDAENCSK